ncbi:pyridoxal phosphate-dependent aminotransferase [Longimicrobium sp.]|uniref:pyridoxal phosphate-dependent aminotransferase n=1 Tax=Longimicrobium sp. TaxID=2029185 RepID=UPI002C8012CB|nr:pyridoxal phosphate-dependent aminotransferase [Longimicrobium sp.]HSU16582.1 pyridoxal phosphate-dependent aminotransferase [Longimicrobium sp.]
MPKLFDTLPSAPTPPDLPGAAYQAAARAGAVRHARESYVPVLDAHVLEVFERARDPRDPFELRDLWLGRVEHGAGVPGHRPRLVEQWRGSRRRRTVEPEEVLSSRAAVRFVKELFNWFFREDLYGDLRDSARVILSSGSVDEERWGLPRAFKACVSYALERDWYGYSDSRGRVPAREAVAAYETARMAAGGYGADNVALTMGGTFAVSSLADFILGNSAVAAPVLCAIPNYPPLVEAVARRGGVRLVPLTATHGTVSLDPLIASLTPGTPLVLLQTAANPTGAAVPEAELARLVASASPSTTILLDECHEWLGPVQPFSAARAAPNVVRISSLSKAWSAPGLKIGWILADARFISEYYEYASTTFGGPPSFFYTAVEVLARMERWILEGVDTPGPREMAEFEASYGLDVRGLSEGYRSYREERRSREHALTTLRAAAVAALDGPSAHVIAPRCSINLAAEFPEWNDSYRCFRELLRDTGVAVFPGILTFCFSGGLMRITTSRRWEDLCFGLERLGGRRSMRVQPDDCAVAPAYGAAAAAVPGAHA